MFANQRRNVTVHVAHRVRLRGQRWHFDAVFLQSQILYPIRRAVMQPFPQIPNRRRIEFRIEIAFGFRNRVIQFRNLVRVLVMRNNRRREPRAFLYVERGREPIHKRERQHFMPMRPFRSAAQTRLKPFCRFAEIVQKRSPEQNVPQTRRANLRGQLWAQANRRREFFQNEVRVLRQRFGFAARALVRAFCPQIIEILRTHGGCHRILPSMCETTTPSANLVHAARSGQSKNRSRFSSPRTVSTVSRAVSKSHSAQTSDADCGNNPKSAASTPHSPSPSSNSPDTARAYVQSTRVPRAPVRRPRRACM